MRKRFGAGKNKEDEKLLKCDNPLCEHPKDKPFTYADFYESKLHRCKKCVLKDVLRRKLEKKEISEMKYKIPKDKRCSRRKGESHLEFAMRYNEEHPIQFSFTSRAMVLHEEAMNKSDVQICI